MASHAAAGVAPPAPPPAAAAAAPPLQPVLLAYGKHKWPVAVPAAPPGNAVRDVKRALREGPLPGVPVGSGGTVWPGSGGNVWPIEARSAPTESSRCTSGGCCACGISAPLPSG